MVGPMINRLHMQGYNMARKQRVLFFHYDHRSTSFRVTPDKEQRLGFRTIGDSSLCCKREFSFKLCLSIFACWVAGDDTQKRMPQWTASAHVLDS